MLQRLLVLLGITAFISLQLQAQPAWHWARTDSNISYAINPGYPRQAVAAHSGTSLWCTIQNRKTTYGQLMLGDYRLALYDSTGKQGVSTMIKGKVSITRVMSDGSGWYVLGFVSDTVELSPSLRIVTSFGNSQYFMARFSQNTLAPVWLQLIGSNQYCSAETFTLYHSGIIIPLDSALSTKVLYLQGSNGALLSTVLTQTGRSYTSYIDADSRGNIYMMGQCVLAGGIDFNGTASTPPTGMQYPWYIARYRAGQYDWHHWIGDITCTDRSFLVANDNSVILSGHLMDSNTLAGHHFAKPPSLAVGDFMMAKLDSNGSLVWAKQRPVTSITQGAISFSTQYHMAAIDTMLYMYTETTGPAVWGNGIATQPTGNRHNATLVAYNTSGNAVWAKAIGSLFSTGQHLSTDGANLWVTGVATDSAAVRFDSLQLPSVLSNYIPYLAKFRVPPAKTTPPASVAPASLGLALSVWPNPASTALYISTNLPALLEVSDIAGKHIWSGTAGNKVTEIATTNWPRGTYLLKASSGQAYSVERIVLH